MTTLHTSVFAIELTKLKLHIQKQRNPSLRQRLELYLETVTSLKNTAKKMMNLSYLLIRAFAKSIKG